MFHTMPQDSRTWHYQRAIPSLAGAGREVMEEVVRRLEQDHWPKHDVFGIQLALEEALVNAIRHGNRLDPAKRVRVTLSLAPDVVRIEIADEGPGFDPAALPDPTDPTQLEAPGGRGILLMRRFMDRLEFNAAGNQVTMEKRRSESP